MNAIDKILQSQEFALARATEQNNPNHFLNVAEHSLMVALQLQDDKVLFITALLHDIAKPLVKTTDDNNIDHFYNHAKESVNIAQRLLTNTELTQEQIEEIIFLINNHDTIIATQKAFNRRARQVSKETLQKLLRLKKADRNAQTTYQQIDKMNEEKKFEEMLDKLN